MIIRRYHYQWILLLYLACAMGFLAVLTVPRKSIGIATGGSALFLVCWFIFYGLIGLGLVFFKPKIRRLDWLIFFPALYGILTVLWSPNMTKTLTYSIVFSFNVVSIILIRQLFTLRQLLYGITIAIFILSILSILLSFLGVEMVKYYDPHNRPTLIGTVPIRGLFNHKITAGLYSAIGAFLALILMRGWSRIIICGVCLFFNLLTGSATGISLVFMGLMLCGLFEIAKNLRLSSRFLVTTLLVIIIGLLVLFELFGQQVLIWLGRDPTLTGRTTLWGWGMVASFDRPVFGWGYLGYIGSDEYKIAIKQFAKFLNYNVPHFHSSYVQIFVDYGYVISSLIIGAYIYSFYHWYQVYMQYRSNISLCMAVLVSTLLLGGAIIYMFARYNDFPSLFFMLSVAYIGLHPDEYI